MRFTLTIFLFSTLLSTISFGQKKISGKILDELSGSPLEFATISVLTLPDSTLISGGVSDIDGNFEIEVPKGNYLLFLEFISYQSQYLGPVAAPITLGAVQLAPSAVAMEEIEVRAERSEMSMKLDKRIFNVGRDLAGRAGNAIDVLENVPSVSVDVEGNVQLRGLSNVRILINGRPSGLTGISSADALRNLPAGSIESVEVITNPSARYEAEGTAGIVNIILKKDNSKGFNALLSLNTGAPLRYGGGLNLNYRRKKVNWFSDIGANYQESIGGGYNNQRFFNAQEVQYSDQNQDRNRSGVNAIFRGGLDYYISDKDILTTYGLFRYGEDNNENSTTYRDFSGEGSTGSKGTLLREIIRLEDEMESGPVAEFSTRYDRTWAKNKHSLSATFQYTTNGEKENNLYNETATELLTSEQTLLNQRSTIDERESRYLFKTDYVDARKKDTEFSTGIQFSLRTIENEFDLDEQQDQEWIPIPEFVNELEYVENIYAGYVSYGRPFGNFSIQTGLRVEHSDISTELKADGTTNPREYTDLFPSAHMSYAQNDKNQFQLSYSRRITRPFFFYLNPFITFADNRNILGGNPDLDPEYSHKFEMGYLRSFEKGSTLLFSTYFSLDQDVISWVTLRQSDIVFRRTPQNLGKRTNLGLEATFSHAVGKWLRMNGDINLFYFDYEGELDGEVFDQENVTLTSRMNFNIRSPKYFDTQLRFNYRGPTGLPQGTSKSITSVDVGMSRDLWDDKLRISVNVRDLFNSRKRRTEILQTDFATDSEFQWRRRIMDIELAYRINRKKSNRERTVNDLLQGGGGGQG